MASKCATKEELLTEIEDRLKYPLCFDLPANNIFQCGNCGYSVCQECYEQIRPRLRTTNREIHLEKVCPQNCRIPLSDDNPIPNLVGKQLAELFRKNQHLFNPVEGSRNNRRLLQWVKLIFGGISVVVAVAIFIWFLVSGIPQLFQLGQEIREFRSSSSQTWNNSFVNDKAKNYFMEKMDKCMNKTDCELMPFINSVFEEETPTWSKTDLEWLQYGSLFLAAQYGTLESVFYILEEGDLDPRKMDDDGINPIHLAMLDDDEKRGKRKTKVLQIFVANRWTSISSSALHAAAKWGNPDKVKTLLEKKTDPNALDASGLTPLFLGMKNENEEMGVKILEELLKNGANCSVTNRDRTADPLDIARQFRSLPFLRQVEALYKKYQPECLEANFRRHEKLLNQLKQLGLREELSVFYYGGRKEETKVKPESEVECKNENLEVCPAP